jgi:hypothetical protein
MKNKYFIILVLILAFVGCQKDMDDQMVQPKSVDNDILMSTNRNPTPAEIGEIPKATVSLLSFPEAMMLKEAVIPSSLEPALFESTLRAGESTSEGKTAFISGAPPKGDILFMMDLTGSMGGELNNAKVNSTNIMNSIASEITDAAFGVVSHMDYPATYTSCGYYSQYGYAGYGDYPYRLDQSITSDKTSVSTALNSLSLGSGVDWPEDYTRVLFETTADANIAWRTGARKFVVAWLDAPPHDCDLGTGADPGRDGVMGTGDDLPDIDPVLQEMKNENITLIVLVSDDEYFSNWQTWAQTTGGDAFLINGDGTIPGGIDIAEYITDIILAQTGTINDLAVEVCTPGFEEWLTDAPSWTNVDLTEPFNAEFDLTYTVPEGTEDGEYEFDVCLIGDGAEYAKQHVKINVVNSIEVPVDIHPTSCPNPVSRGVKGVLPVAILGFDGFDVTMIDSETIRLEGVAPIRWTVEDVAAPYMPFVDKPLNKLSCNTSGPDGLMDLSIKFDLLLFKTLLAGYVRNDVVKMHLTGNLKDGTPILGEDIIVIVK